MTWKVACAMDERVRFIADVLGGERNVSQWCALYGISRKTGHKWLARYRALGSSGLQERRYASQGTNTSTFNSASASKCLVLAVSTGNWCSMAVATMLASALAGSPIMVVGTTRSVPRPNALRWASTCGPSARG